MKNLIVLVILLFPLIGYSQTSEKEVALLDTKFARCTGSAYCNACKSCNYCKHCNSGGSCGMCSPSLRKNTNTSSRRFSDHYVYVKNAKMNLRSGPGTSYSIIATVEQDTELYIISYYSEQWLKVKLTVNQEGGVKEIEAYAYKSLLKDDL